MQKREAELEARDLNQPGNEWLIMVHPNLEDSYQKVTIAAYEEVWRKVGWQKASDLLDEEGQPASWSQAVEQSETAPPENTETEVTAESTPEKKEK
jgi:hypothetical protein